MKITLNNYDLGVIKGYVYPQDKEDFMKGLCKSCVVYKNKINYRMKPAQINLTRNYQFLEHPNFFIVERKL